MLTRRHFLKLTAATAAAAPFRARAQGESVSFFLIGDTHYLANLESPGEMDATSRAATSRLIDTLNKLPGSELPAALGGGLVPAPRGVLHAGDLIDSGDDPKLLRAQETEWRAWEADFGLAGGDGRLRAPIFEVFGNHDAPHGEGLVLDAIRARNQRRPGVVCVSEDGAHYAWDFGPVHCVALGIVVGGEKGGARPRRFAALESLRFLEDDLAANVGDSGRPVVLLHHVDVARYSYDGAVETPPARLEWDPSDVRAYHEALAGYRVAAICYGHTHQRRLFRWDGTADARATVGIPTLNTDNVAHFNFTAQALLHVEIDGGETRIREYATKDNWATGAWTPEMWRFAHATA